MITIGYGDIYPVTIYEKIYVIFAILGGCITFGYVLNSLGGYFST